MGRDPWIQTASLYSVLLDILCKWRLVRLILFDEWFSGLMGSGVSRAGSARFLEVELTEGAVMTDPKESIAVL